MRERGVQIIWGEAMIKIMFCLRRLPEFTLQEFHDYWRLKHAPLVISVAPILGIKRYVQSHRFSHKALDLGVKARGGLAAPYDGVAELWYEDVQSMEFRMGSGSTPEIRRAGRSLLEDERRFIDLPNSNLFWVNEHEIIPYASGE